MLHISRRSALLASAIIAATLLSHPAFAQAPASPRHDYFFGDSDLEQGNFQIIAGQTANERAPYFCTGGLCRDSNGPVWAELLTPGLRPDLAGPPRGQSLNFAVSGAHLSERGDADLPVSTGVVSQIARFAALQDAGAIAIHPSDRFFIHAGSNDLIRLLQGVAPDEIRDQIVESATANVTTLAGLGARTIIIAQVQPVQYLPLLAGPDNEGLRGALGTFIQDTNLELKASLSVLKTSLPAGTNLVLMDQGAFFNRLRGHSAELGFASIDTACYDRETGTLCSTDPSAQNRYAFFDSNHLSAAGQVLLADWYRATLDAASGEASRSAGRIPDVLLNHAVRVDQEMLAARGLMAGGGQAFAFAAPFAVDRRLEHGEEDVDLQLEPRGILFGAQAPLGQYAFAGIAVAALQDKARIGAASGFDVQDWSGVLFGGVHAGPVRLSAHASYARPKVRDFRRNTGALGIIATGRTEAERWGLGAEIGGDFQLGPVRLQPGVGLDYGHVTVAGFAESDAVGLALFYDRQRASQLTLNADLKASVVAVDMGDRLSVEPYLHLRDRTRLSSGAHDVGSTLIDNTANTASIRSASTGGDWVDIGAGVDVRLGRGTVVGLAYDHAAAGPERGGSLSLRLVAQF